MKLDTIAAIITPKGKGGVGIIRISGEKSEIIAKNIYITKKKSKKIEKYKKFQHRRIYIGKIIDPEVNAEIDEVILLKMAAPNSYTREDIIEIQAHGGEISLKKILKIVLKQGARLSEPGEFTKRAFLNGRIDLTQAEAVIDVINAKNEKALMLANNILNGKIGSKIKNIKMKLTEVLMQLEADIEFEEEIEINEKTYIEEKITESLNTANQCLKRLIANFESFQKIKEGIKTVIVGRPNVGKSSLMNKILERKRSIVSDTPGTTRDFIEEETEINGIFIKIIDTAGIHRSEDPIEKEGIKIAEEIIEEADIIIFMIDATIGIEEAEKHILKKIKEKVVIPVINKIDLKETKEEFLDKLQISKISLKENIGIEKLINRIVEEGVGIGVEENDIAVTLRQKEQIEIGIKLIESAKEKIKNRNEEELAVIDIKEAIQNIGAVTGEGIQTEILDKIFSKFCIGK